MASSCDDDFALLADESPASGQSHHQSHRHHLHLSQQQQAAAASFVTHRFVTSKQAVPVHSSHALTVRIASPKKSAIAVGDDEDQEVYGEAFAQADAAASALPSSAAGSFRDVNPHHCFTTADDAAVAATAATNPFVSHLPEEDDDGDDGDSNRHPLDKGRGTPVSGTAVGIQPSRLDIKRKDRDELSDGGSPYCFNSSGSGKKTRLSSSVDYRKDREEWSDSAITCLLDAYTEKYVQLNRGNLRGRDWEDVATIVSERCDKQKSGKSVEQCKNKVDNLKKRYKAERQRLSSGSLSVSHWPWFKKMEQIVGSSSTYSKPIAEDDKAIVAGGDVSSSAAARQNKRYSVTNPGPVNFTNSLKTKPLSTPRWRRVVLKISGDAFVGSGSQNVDPKVIMLIAREIATTIRIGVEVAIVVGGRNFFCGDSWVAATGIDRPIAYQVGMMATVMNSVLLQASLEKIGVQTRVQTSFMMQDIAEPYVRRKAIRHLEKGRVVIFGGVSAGSGTPFFNTDTAAALRASELGADAVLKGLTVDSIVDCHQRSNNGITFEHISFRELLSGNFSAMDPTAITLCEEHNIPVVIFNLLETGNISRALCGDQVGTLIDQSGRISGC